MNESAILTIVVGVGSSILSIVGAILIRIATKLHERVDECATKEEFKELVAKLGGIEERVRGAERDISGIKTHLEITGRHELPDWRRK